jgi:dihydroorotase-like cyclic amidohydrolase
MTTTVVKNVLLFDGTQSHSNATVIFDSSTGKITSVSTGSNIAQHPSGATVIDGKGHTLLPGLIESHMHCHGMHLPEGASEADILRSPLKSGITTVCDMFSPLDAVNKLRTAAAKDLEQAKQGGGSVTMSDLKSCIVAATIAGGWPKPIILSGHPSAEVGTSLWSIFSTLQEYS